jgi:hypothetical protein
MTVYVEKLGDNSRYNWRVKVGKGRGSRIKSRHRLKRRALQRGKAIASDRGDILKEQLQWGGWRTVRSY